jgi:hypothetical protein
MGDRIELDEILGREHAVKAHERDLAAAVELHVEHWKTEKNS